MLLVVLDTSVKRPRLGDLGTTVKRPRLFPTFGELGDLGTTVKRPRTSPTFATLLRFVCRFTDWRSLFHFEISRIVASGDRRPTLGR